MPRNAISSAPKEWSRLQRTKIGSWLLLWVLFSLTACGEAEPVLYGPAPVTCYKFAEDPWGMLNRTEEDELVSVVLSEDFAEGHDSWQPILNLDQVLEGGSEDFRFTTLKQAGHTFVRLEGSQGALCRIVKVKPSTVYRFKAQVRSNGVVPAGPKFFGAASYLVELNEFGEADLFFKQGIQSRIVSKLGADSTYELSGWQEHRKLFRTGPDTEALLIACMLSLDTPVQEGTVDFRDLELIESSSRQLQEQLLQADVRAFAQGEAPLEGWHARRRVKALIGTEVRPAFVLFPGESLTFNLIMPARDPVFETGMGAWRPALKDHLLTGQPSMQRLQLTISGKQELSWNAAPAERLVDERWTEARIHLPGLAGQGVQFVFTNTGDLPGVFGAPILREGDRSPEYLARPNLLLISIDTLRSDHLGSYGYDGETSPHLDALAEQSIRYSNVISQGPWTLPSHASLFSGQYSSVHGIRHLGHVLSSQRSPILARMLSQRGYRTRAFTGGGFVNPGFGFDKGFDGFSNIDTLSARDAEILVKQVENAPERYSTALLEENGPEAVKDWLTQNRDQPFFLFLHTYTVHEYDPPADWSRCAERGCTHPKSDWHQYRLNTKTGWRTVPYTEANRQHLNHTYDDALRYVDHLVGDILAHLESLGLDENTVVAVTSDHGEELLERGHVQHGKRLYEEDLRIPMILRIPSRAPAVDDRHVMQIDLLPTLLAALGIEPDARIQGMDLLGPKQPERLTWSEVRDPLAHKYAAYTAQGWKLLHSPSDETIAFENRVEWELYDLSKDAGEHTNLAQPGFEPFESLLKRLEQQRELNALLSENMAAVGTGELDAAAEEALKNLGYVDSFEYE